MRPVAAESARTRRRTGRWWRPGSCLLRAVAGKGRSRQPYLAFTGTPGRRRPSLFQELGFHSGFAELGLQPSWPPAFSSLEEFSVPGSGCSVRHSGAVKGALGTSRPSRRVCESSHHRKASTPLPSRHAETPTYTLIREEPSNGETQDFPSGGSSRFPGISLRGTLIRAKEAS